MKKYITKPIQQTVVSAIQINEENRQEIEDVFKDAILYFFYHDEFGCYISKDYQKDEKFSHLGCMLFIHDAHCQALEGDFIVLLNDGRITARNKEGFEEKFEPCD